MSLRVHHSSVRIPFRADERTEARGSELDLDVAWWRRTRVRRVLVLREQDTPALQGDLEVADPALGPVEAAMGALELILGVGHVGAQQLELRPVALVELRRHPR